MFNSLCCDNRFCISAIVEMKERPNSCSMSGVVGGVPGGEDDMEVISVVEGGKVWSLFFVLTVKTFPVFVLIIFVDDEGVEIGFRFNVLSFIMFSTSSSCSASICSGVIV